jgi:hypothetical protein
MNYSKKDIAASRCFWAVTWAITTLMLLISGLFMLLGIVR